MGPRRWSIVVVAVAGRRPFTVRPSGVVVQAAVSREDAQGRRGFDAGHGMRRGGENIGEGLWQAGCSG